RWLARARSDHRPDRPPPPAGAAACPWGGVPRDGGSSLRSGSATASRPAPPNPPAKLPDDRPRGSSSKASGLPRASAMIRSRTWASSGPNDTEATSSVASVPTNLVAAAPAAPPARGGERGREYQADRLGDQAA